MNRIPRGEHPRPDRKRESILNLNGEWEFEIDNAKVGLEKGYPSRERLDGKIMVPFCPESKLSGVAHTDFMNAVWYRKQIELPKEWEGRSIILHIDACDYFTTVFVNGEQVGTHKGGYTSFAFDITSYLKKDENVITVYAEDDIRSEKQVSGKQSHKLGSYRCMYTRTTGIWQTVWLEAVEPAYVVSYKAYPNISTPSVSLETLVSEAAIGGTLTVTASYEGREVGSASTKITSKSTFVELSLSEKHLWEVGVGRLYDLSFQLEKDGRTDCMSGYFGLREVALTKQGLKINGKTVFGRFVLDQGFYPEGIITAPSDDALLFDIKASMACGFNGARLHQKVFEPRFLYHADRLGYMVWSETGNWGLDHTLDSAIYHFLPEWLEEMERDFSHPSVIGWCPFNETWDKHGRQQCNEFIDLVYDVTKAMDQTRPVIANSGSYPTSRTDLNDIHDYEQDPIKFKETFSELNEGIVKDQIYRKTPQRQLYRKELPLFVSEYGGIKWIHVANNEQAWGYGSSVKTEEEFFERLEGLTDVLLQDPAIIGYCYTQLTDVEQEQNGLLTYERQFKFEPEKFKAVFAKKSVIED